MNFMEKKTGVSYIFIIHKHWQFFFCSPHFKNIAHTLTVCAEGKYHKIYLLEMVVRMKDKRNCKWQQCISSHIFLYDLLFTLLKVSLHENAFVF